MRSTITDRLTAELQRTIPRYYIPDRLPQRERTLNLKQAGAILNIAPSLLSFNSQFWPNFPRRKVGCAYAIRPAELKRWLEETPDGQAFRNRRIRLNRWTEPDWRAIL